MSVVVLAVVLGVGVGNSSLNVVALCGVIALGVGFFQLVRAEAPTISRLSIDPGFPGETKLATIALESDVPCTVTETLGEGLTAPAFPDRGPEYDLGHGGTFEYELRLERRGEHRIGPARCRRTDSFGLFSTTETTDGTDSVLVYPTVYEIDAEALSYLDESLRGNDRTTFDRLREYTPNDRLRDIHWLASAKRPDDDLLVAEYRDRSETPRATIAGEATAGDVDAMASAVASIAAHLSAAGLTVSVTLPDGSCTAAPGEIGSILRALAHTDGGRLSAKKRQRADLRVEGGNGDGTASISGQEFKMDGRSNKRRNQEVIA